jgi:RNA polymerase sigma-70 factor (ECF subfamily)
MASDPASPGRAGEARSASDVLRQVLAQRPFLMAFLVSLVRDFGLAEELFQDLCVAAGAGGSGPTRATDVAAWARDAARRRALAVLRARAASGSRMPPPELVDQIERAIAELAASQERWARRKEALRECLRNLPAPLRQVLNLRYGQDLSTDRIAARLGLERVPAGELLQRARAEMEALAQRRLGAPGDAR